MLAKLRAAFAAERAYETRWPLRSYAIRTGERVCGVDHRKLHGRCARCQATR